MATTPICNPHICRVLLGTVGYCGVLWSTVGCCGVLWGTMGLLWGTVAGILTEPLNPRDPEPPYPCLQFVEEIQTYTFYKLHYTCFVIKYGGFVKSSVFVKSSLMDKSMFTFISILNNNIAVRYNSNYFLILNKCLILICRFILTTLRPRSSSGFTFTELEG